MLWALLSSAFVIYLYRKLNAEGTPRAAQADAGGQLETELATLNERIAALETRLTTRRAVP